MAHVKHFTTESLSNYYEFSALSQNQNDNNSSVLCNNRQHYIVGVPQGSVLGPSVVLYIKNVFLFRDNFAFIFHLCNASYHLPHIFKNNGKLLLTTAVLVKEMEPLSQLAKRSHPQDPSITVNSCIICLPLVQEIRNNIQNPSNTAEPAQHLLITSPENNVVISLTNSHNQTVN